jgi:predicted ferric reductase
LPPKKTLLLAGVAVLYLAVIIVFISNPKPDIYHAFARLFALLGIVTLYLAVVISAYGRWLSAAFGRSAKTIHHWFSISGIVLISLHPISLLVENLDFSIFVPQFDSLEVFWNLAGRLALILIYIALTAVLLRKSIPRYWRIFHALVYIALILGITHGILMGADLEGAALRILFEAMGASLVAIFIYRRLRRTT